MTTAPPCWSPIYCSVSQTQSKKHLGCVHEKGNRSQWGGDRQGTCRIRLFCSSVVQYIHFFYVLPTLIYIQPCHSLSRLHLFLSLDNIRNSLVEVNLPEMTYLLAVCVCVCVCTFVVYLCVCVCMCACVRPCLRRARVLPFVHVCVLYSRAGRLQGGVGHPPSRDEKIRP